MESQDSFYANTDLNGSGNGVLTTAPQPRRDPYDEITVNFGRPVIQPQSPKDDPFSSVTFSSPIITPPIPAPRLSKQKIATPSTCDILDVDGDASSNDDEVKEPPQVPPRNIILKPDLIYEEIEEEEEILHELGARPRKTKSDTIDIRNTITQWYDEASEEIERDLSLDLSILEAPPPPMIKEEDEDLIETDNEAEEAKCPTLLRDFDPILRDEQLKAETAKPVAATRQLPEPTSAVAAEALLEDEAEKSGNYYVTVPFTYTNRDSMASSTASYSSEPPMSPPPPLPQTEPPKSSAYPVSYENIWINPVDKKPQLEAPPPVPPRLKPKQPSFLAARSNDDSAISSSASSSSNDVHALSTSVSSCNIGNGGNVPQRSFSALNLATRFASNIKRKMSDQNIMIQGRVNGVVTRTSPSRLSNRTKNAFLSPTSPLGSSSAYQSQLKTRSGVLYVYSRTRHNFQPKWCVLTHLDFKYFNDKQMVAVPKETVLVASVLSVEKHQRAAYAPQKVEIFTFNIGYLNSNGKHRTLSLGAATESEREKWIDKLAFNLDHLLLEQVHSNSKFTWVQLKTGFAGTWNKSWISIDATRRWLKYTEEVDSYQIDLKKVKNLTLVKDVKNLAAPLSHNLPVLVMDCLDRSLYLQSLAEKEILALKDAIESMAFSNSNCLSDQQLTNEDIPVIVEKCIGFVYGHGCMTEGIYRHSGVNTKINKLLELFKNNVWAVHLTRESFSEHDVANALKRFFRTLKEPILTVKYRTMFMQAVAVEDHGKKIERYRNLVQLLPSINYNTLKKLMAHLVAIASHSGKNLMPNYNLGAIWGPSLLTVDSMEASTYAQTSSESDVCRDLIDNYRFVFDVPEEELDKEAKISETLEKINKFDRGRCLLKRSGDLRLWVYIDTKSSGNCVCVIAKPTMTALEMTQKVLEEKELSPEVGLVLHEAVLGGALQRPIHHSELVLDVALKWGAWDEEDRRDNYLLLKHNILYEEAIHHANQTFSVFGEAFFADLKSKSFKKNMLSMSNARLTINKNEDVELASWPIEEISWYLGCESKRHPPHSLNMTFIHPRGEPVARSKDRPYFGRTISFESRDFYIKWIAAMLVAEYPNELRPKSSNNHENLVQFD